MDITKETNEYLDNAKSCCETIENYNYLIELCDKIKRMIEKYEPAEQTII